MKRIRLTVAYDGTDYHGWALQESGNSVEAELNRALSEKLGEDIRVIGASRTDAGVHAYGNIAVFDTETPIPPEKICHAINTALPRDIRILKSEEVPADWHPRKADCKKTYEYRILVGDVPIPTEIRYAHYVRKSLDIEAMDKAAHFIEGEHDFSAFCAAGSQATSMVRNVYSASVRPFADASAISSCGAVISVTGNGFLYNMVRIIAGTLLDVGTGRIRPEGIPGIIESKDRRMAGPTLPPEGLFLMGYEYY